MGSELERLVSRSLGRREFLRYTGLYTGVALGAGVLAACREATDTGGQQGAAQARPAIGEEPGTLEVFDWDGYGNGSFGSAELWKQYGKEFPEPKFILFKDDDSGYAKVRAGARYDIVHPCAYRFQDWVDLPESGGGSVLTPWDTSLIPNFSALNPALQEFGNFGGDQYFVVPDWGFAAPMYNADEVTPTEDSWGLLWDERYKGKISWWDSLNMMIVSAYYNGVPDPWNMTDQELEQQRDFLISKIGLTRTLWPIDPTADFLNGEVTVTYAWPSHWWIVKDYGSGKGMNAEYMNPKEGRTSWYCGFALFDGTENYHHAHEYVDSWASAASGLWLINNYAYGHSNTSVDLGGVSKELVDTFSLDDPTVLEEPNSHPERPIARRDVYEELWLEVKAAG